MKNYKFYLLFILVFANLSYTAPRNFHTIVSNQAYRSSQPSPKELLKLLNLYEIKTVINMRGRDPSAVWWVKESQICEKFEVKLIDIPFSAHSLPPAYVLLQLYDAIVESEHPILIHCEGGANRTGAAAAIWRMIALGESRESASRELSKKYYHSKLLCPAMDLLVEVFEPSREWIEREYPILKENSG